MNATYTTQASANNFVSADVQVSVFDRVNAALIALILLFGFLVAMMFLIWCSPRLDDSHRAARPWQPVDPFSETEDDNDDESDDLETDLLEPGVEEFPEVEQPQLKDALEAVTDAVSSVQANREHRDGEALAAGLGFGWGRGNRGVPEFVDDIPEHKRWTVEYESESIELYARQLDFFQIYLGAFSLNSNDIVVVRQLTDGGKLQMSDRKEQSKILRFEHRKPRMRRWDQILVKRAGVDLEGRRTVQFYPTETRSLLRAAEARHLSSVGRSLDEVRRTIFRLEPVGSGFEFKVRDMLFRN